MTSAHDDRPEHLLALVHPMLERLSTLPTEGVGDATAARALEDELEATWPWQGSVVQAIGAEIRHGVEEGWLCDRGDPDARFGRLAKPSARTGGASIDVVALAGAGAPHGHPRGEITLGFDAAGAAQSRARFEGRPPGWVVMPSGSVHTPTSDHGRMHLIYFLPGGAVDWNPPRSGP